MEEAVALMPNASSDSPLLKKLEYIYEENLRRETEFGGSDFGGYPTLAQRTDSFDVRESMRVHCGLVFLSPSFFHVYVKNFPCISSSGRGLYIQYFRHTTFYIFIPFFFGYMFF